MLHAEISTYGEMQAQMVHEELATIMNRCFEIFGFAIRKHKGTLYRTGSNDITALFGFPEAHENAPKQAGFGERLGNTNGQSGHEIWRHVGGLR